MTNQDFIESIRLEGEEWREIPGWEGFYCASTFGRIASLGRYVACKGSSRKWNNPRLLKPNKSNRAGYFLVPLCCRNNVKRCSIHRLVALTFINNPHNKPCIDHIDGDKTNNRADNLRWCTMRENMRNQNTKERLRIFYENDSRKKRVRPVVSIKDGLIVRTYPSISSVKADNHSEDNVYLVCSGRRNSHHGFQWMYLSDYEKLVSMSKNS